jgi:hypothetical protein
VFVDKIGCLFDSTLYAAPPGLFFLSDALGIRVLRSNTGNPKGKSKVSNKIAIRRYHPNIQNVKVKAPATYSNFNAKAVLPSASFQYVPTSSHKAISKVRNIRTKTRFVRRDRKR